MDTLLIKHFKVLSSWNARYTTNHTSLPACAGQTLAGTVFWKHCILGRHFVFLSRSLKMTASLKCPWRLYLIASFEGVSTWAKEKKHRSTFYLLYCVCEVCIYVFTLSTIQRKFASRIALVRGLMQGVLGACASLHTMLSVLWSVFLKNNMPI